MFVNWKKSLPWALVLTVVLSTTTALAEKGGAKGKPGSGGVGGNPPLPVTFMIQWLPPGTRVDRMNNQGDCVGGFRDELGTYYGGLVFQGVVYDVADLITDSNWTLTSAADISNRNEIAYVVGRAWHNGIRVAYRLKLQANANGEAPTVLEIIDLGLLPGDTSTVPNSVNASGDVVGSGRDPSDYGTGDAFLYTDGTGITAVNYAYPLWNGSIRISDTGFIATGFRDPNTEEFGVYRRNPQGEFEVWSGYYTTVAGINDSGSFVGERNFPMYKRNGSYLGNERLAYVNTVASGGAFRKLEPAFWAQGINNFGDIVAQGFKGTSINYLYLANQDAMFRIDDLLDSANSDEDVTLWFSNITHVRQINDAGCLGGYLQGSLGTGFILIPVAP